MITALIAVAGGLGAAARFGVDTAVQRRRLLAIPLGTFVVNTSACLLLGLVTGWCLAHPGHDQLRAVLGVGFLGGYSTFSTASVEGARLALAGQGFAAFRLATAMLVACLAAAAIGITLIGP